MANVNPEESSPLLGQESEKVVPEPILVAPAEAEKATVQVAPAKGYGGEWAAEGLPAVVVGEPVAARGEWDSGIFSCLGRNDEFCSSDLEVCLLGSLAPCVLYGSNVERLSAGPGSFATHCLPYTGLFMLGNSMFGSNCIAPWFSYPTRTAIRRRFNLEGSCEAFARSHGCCHSVMEDDEKREYVETVCDFATHYFLHPCALCQEGRELRRRLPHPGFNASVTMLPPVEQNMMRN